MLGELASVFQCEFEAIHQLRVVPVIRAMSRKFRRAYTFSQQSEVQRPHLAITQRATPALAKSEALPILRECSEYSFLLSESLVTTDFRYLERWSLLIAFRVVLVFHASTGSFACAARRCFACFILHMFQMMCGPQSRPK